MVIRVRRKHVLMGRRGNSSECPVALAVKEATKSDNWEVGLFGIYERGIQRAKILDPVRRFITSFDKSKGLRRVLIPLPPPFEIDL